MRFDVLSAREGSVLPPDAPLMQYYDPRELRVATYVPPEHLGAVRPGKECSVFRAGTTAEFRGWVEAIGSSWAPRPLTVQRSDEEESDLFVPVWIRLAGASPIPMRPQSRLKVVFARRDSSTGE